MYLKIFQFYLQILSDARHFPSVWGKANAVLSHKEKRQGVKNYRSVSLLPISSKVVERIIFNTIFPYFLDNNLVSENQSGFRSGGSYVNYSFKGKNFYNFRPFLFGTRCNLRIRESFFGETPIT